MSCIDGFLVGRRDLEIDMDLIIDTCLDLKLGNRWGYVYQIFYLN